MSRGLQRCPSCLSACVSALTNPLQGPGELALRTADQRMTYVGDDVFRLNQNIAPSGR